MLTTLHQEAFELKYSRTTPLKKYHFNVKKYVRPKFVLGKLLSFMPILHWLPKYDWKNSIQGDIIGGLTVGIMHVPQGMAYASLASLPPVYGIYSSFFASTIYLLFGTSRHVSIGCFAVGSMMCGAIRLKYLPDPEVITELVNDTVVRHTIPIKSEYDLPAGLTPVMLTSVLTLAAGLIQLVMAVLHLDFLTTYMSDTMVSGFTTGAAFHVFVAQLNKILGVKLPRYSGPGMLFLMVRDFVLMIPKSNFYTIAISAFSLLFLYIGHDYVNPWVAKHSRVPVPFELLLVIITTVFSAVVNLSEEYNMQIVAHIPQGIPVPSMPKLEILPLLIGDAIGVAIVAYMFVISMGKLFAKKKGYKVDAGQELYAVGFVNTFSSFFPVFTTGVSLSRSAVCFNSGANTQLYAIFSSSLLLIVILWLGPLLEPLPMCVLGCIVMISLKSLFMQFRDVPRLWKISKFDTLVWLVCCIATLSNDVMTGLTISIAFTLLSVVLREQWPKVFHIGKARSDNIFKPIYRYSDFDGLPSNITIVRFEAPLHFVNVARFGEAINELIQLEPTDENCNNTKAEERTSYKELAQKESTVISMEGNEITGSEQIISTKRKKRRFIIVDCGAISIIDVMGIEALRHVYQDANRHSVDIFFADVSETILDTLDTINFFEEVPKSVFFPDLNQAVIFASSPVPSE